jgi:hypothetical protein
LRDFLGYSLNDTVLIVNGRVHANIELTDVTQLRRFDVWSKCWVLPFVTLHREALKTPLARAVLSCFLVDWHAMGLSHDGFNGGHPEDLQASYTSKHRQAMKLDIRINPFSQECQRLIDFIYYLEVREILTVRFVITPPMNLSQGDVWPLSAFYRAAFLTDTPAISLLGDGHLYQTAPVVPRRLTRTRSTSRATPSTRSSRWTATSQISRSSRSTTSSIGSRSSFRRSSRNTSAWRLSGWGSRACRSRGSTNS